MKSHLSLLALVLWLTSILGEDAAAHASSTLVLPQMSDTAAMRLAALEPGGTPPTTGDPSSEAPSITWESLGGVLPQRIDRAGLRASSLSVNPPAGSRAAYCQPGGIRTTADGGATWDTIETGPVGDIAATTDFPIASEVQALPACTAVLLDPRFPQSVYAEFVAQRGTFGIPPLYFVGYGTSDAGRTWYSIPTPDNSSPGQFGGFQLVDAAVEALFEVGQPFRADPASFVVEQTEDGGASWSPSPLTCPTSGPCIRWGPAPSGIGSCAMHGYDESVEVSVDGGASWRP